jgi:hypothetical protein
MNKPFLLIAGDRYYPRSGTRDWKGRYDTYEEAESQIIKNDDDTHTFKDCKYDWYEIVDLRDSENL